MLMKEILDKFSEDYYFATGSRVYGGFSKDSDYDYVLMPGGDTETKLLTIRSLENVTTNLDYGEDNYSIIVECEDGKLNLICPERSFFNEWKFATQIMTKFPPIDDKEKRIATFKDLQEYYMHNEFWLKNK